MHPRAHTSEAYVYGCPAINSGDMYSGVPCKQNTTSV